MSSYVNNYDDKHNDIKSPKQSQFSSCHRLLKLVDRWLWRQIQLKWTKTHTKWINFLRVSQHLSIHLLPAVVEPEGGSPWINLKLIPGQHRETNNHLCWHAYTLGQFKVSRQPQTQTTLERIRTDLGWTSKLSTERGIQTTLLLWGHSANQYLSVSQNIFLIINSY